MKLCLNVMAGLKNKPLKIRVSSPSASSVNLCSMPLSVESNSFCLSARLPLGCPLCPRTSCKKQAAPLKLGAKSVEERSREGGLADAAHARQAQHVGAVCVLHAKK